MTDTVIQRVVRELEALLAGKRLEVLEFAAKLRATSSHGVAGRSLVAFAGSIPAADLAEMRETIEAGCEQIDADEW